MCLDPAASPEKADALAQSFRGLVAALGDYQAQFHRAMRGRFAATSTYCKVREALDYALTQRGMVLAEGVYRTDKSYLAQA